MNNLFPEYLTHQSLWLFLLQLVFVVMVFLGQYFLCLFLQRRKNVFSDVAVESFLFVPFLLFPLALLFSFFHRANLFYGVAQTVFLSFAAAGLWKNRKRFGLALFKNIGKVEWVCYAVILVVGAFGWLVPIPDNFNGHGHSLWNVLQQMLGTGHYAVLSKADLASDDMTQLFFPPHFVFWLRLYCLPDALFFYRPAFIVPMLVGFLLVHLVKKTAPVFGFPKNAGLLGFLAVIGSFFNSLILYEIQYDSLSLLMLLYGFYLFGRFLVQKEPVWNSLLALLFFSFMVRTQIFIILFLTALLLFLFSFKSVAKHLKIKPFFLLLGIVPVLVWTGVAWRHYDNPLWPMSRGIVQRVLNRLDPTSEKPPVPLMVALPLQGEKNGATQGEARKKYGSRVRYFLGEMDAFFPENGILAPLFERTSSLFLFAVRVGPLSLALALLFSILILCKKMPGPRKEFWAVTAALFLGWLVEYLVFYRGHNKFPQYLSAMTLWPAGLVLFSFGKKYFRPVSVALAVLIFLSFNLLLFGRRNIDPDWTPLKILSGQKTFLGKLAYKSNNSIAETEAASSELDRAYASGRRVLHIEVEPGALLPSLMGREFLGRAYYLSMNSTPLKEVLEANNATALGQALKNLNIDFVFIPQRDHGILEQHPLFLVLRRFRAEGKNRLVVPVGAILENIRYGP